MTRRFGLYKYIVPDTQTVVIRYLIVIKEDRTIVQWTDFHKYVRMGSPTRIRKIESEHESRYYDIVKLLNYVFFEKQHVRRLTDITTDMVKEFLKKYGLCMLEGDTEWTHRSETTVKHMVASLISFFEEVSKEYPDCKVRKKEFFEEKEFFNKKKRKWENRKVPAFEILCNPSSGELLRDMPEAVFQIIFNKVLTQYKDILMIVAACAFGGLRPSEACNMRREDSPLGRGLYIDMIDGDVHSITIDLRRELHLRSDHLAVGKIKKERLQKIYPAFLDIFWKCYRIYMAYMDQRDYETQYGALSVSRNGKAFTYSNYRTRCQQAVKDCIPEMLESDDPEVVEYAHLLQENNIAPHIFRHWFSVKLTLFGEDVSGLMYWRGDTHPESSLRYLMRKSDLEREYEKINNGVFDYSMWKAEKLIKDDNTGVRQ